ncbi:ammonia-forming cytochrome c nitrite reductase subunit c552 [Vulgatibacter sp.]|uniref:ammonia-forming cytochrome c nitrite reductase subunit c552 n=1 Tax=Vulgatibacter sp. TaxID=1971226 RepID=UPI0035640B63
MNTPENKTSRRLGTLVLAAVVAAAAAAGAAALLVNITEKKQEARQPFFSVVELTDETDDPAIWGKNFPIQYDQYTKTVDMERTKHGGSEALPHEPTAQDPRTVVSQSKIELDPRLKKLWAGYAFAKDFREERGHAYMFEDQKLTQRVHVVNQPGTCMHCHASVYNVYKKAGDGDLMAGFEKVNQMPYHDAAKLAEHPVACIDCHDPKTMQLRVTRPGFIEGIAALKKHEGIANYDVNRDATRQEMRSYVCGQCHVEYHFKGDKKRLTYPWENGLTVDGAYEYYQEIGFKDWTHAETGAPSLKAQHPEFELYSQGTHAKAGVACADCHMPYTRVGAQKVSDHHVRSPLLNVNKACQTCHKASEAELQARVEGIQDKTIHMRDKAMDAHMALIEDIKEAKAAGFTAEQLAKALELQRKSGFYTDYVEAENSVGFHAPQEAMRILGEAAEYARLGQLAVREAGFVPTKKTEEPSPVMTAVPAPAPAAAPAAPAAPAPAQQPTPTATAH